MIDRDNTVFAVRGLTFPSRKNLEESLRDTLVDGVSESKHKSILTSSFVKRELSKWGAKISQ